MADDEEIRPSTTVLWIGRVLSALPVLMLVMSAGMKLSKSQQVVEGITKFGYSEAVILPLGVVELVATVLYCIPQTAVLGAIILTGYLGGATATHVRAGEPFFVPIVLGVVLWLGLLLRDRRLQSLLPLRKI
jgi:hypothetical protein